MVHRSSKEGRGASWAGPVCGANCEPRVQSLQSLQSLLLTAPLTWNYDASFPWASALPVHKQTLKKQYVNSLQLLPEYLRMGEVIGISEVSPEHLDTVEILPPLASAIPTTELASPQVPIWFPLKHVPPELHATGSWHCAVDTVSGPPAFVAQWHSLSGAATIPGPTPSPQWWGYWTTSFRIKPKLYKFPAI